jgi:hypothetical protein
MGRPALQYSQNRPVLREFGTGPFNGVLEGVDIHYNLEHSASAL